MVRLLMNAWQQVSHFIDDCYPQSVIPVPLASQQALLMEKTRTLNTVTATMEISWGTCLAGIIK